MTKFTDAECEILTEIGKRNWMDTVNELNELDFVKNNLVLVSTEISLNILAIQIKAISKGSETPPLQIFSLLTDLIIKRL